MRRVIDPSHAVVSEHAHDWPMISLFVMGSYRNVTEGGEQEIAGPSLVFYRPGVAHRNFAGGVGFEQIEIEFDPAWLGRSELPPEGVVARVGGACGALARALAVRCDSALSEAALEGEIRRLLSVARREPPRQMGACGHTPVVASTISRAKWGGAAHGSAPRTDARSGKGCRKPLHGSASNRRLDYCANRTKLCLQSRCRPGSVIRVI